MNKKYALCVGTNYPGTDAQLSGCVNDALDWKAVLEAEGYAVTLLTDAEATRLEIRTQLEQLIGAAGFGDRVVFTYSGHGTWLPDQNGDEIDGRDEAICPTDFRQAGVITDDELAGILGRARTSAVLFLSDSCHSGTVSRLGALTGVPDGRGAPRFYPPHLFTDISQDRAVEIEQRVDASPRKTSSLISGCDDREYSYDAWFGNRANGAFTRAAIGTFQPRTTLARWFNAIRDELPNGEHPQSPQLTAASTYRKYSRAL